MGTKKQRRASKADSGIEDQFFDWRPDDEPWDCGHGWWDEKYCHRCDEESDGAAYAYELNEQANRQRILELVRRWGSSPSCYKEAVIREGCLHCAVALIAEDHSEMMGAREAQWELLCTLLSCSAEGYYISKCYAPRWWAGEKQATSLQFPWIVALGCLSKVAPSAKSANEVLRGFIDDPNYYVCQEVILALVELDPSMPGLAYRIAELHPQDDRAIRAFTHLFTTINSAASPEVLDVLLDAIKQRSSRAVRRSVAEALARIGQVSVQILSALERCVQDIGEDTEAREAARQALIVLCEKLREGSTGPLPQGEEEGFLLAVWNNADDLALFCVYADWLEERGHAPRARLVRLQHERFLLALEDPRVLPICDQIVKVRTELEQLDPAWLAVWEYLIERRSTPQSNRSATT
jgi:uncharacterized protein (TIGR02996 family)